MNMIRMDIYPTLKFVEGRLYSIVELWRFPTLEYAASRNESLHPAWAAH